jgi:hypothetical protein
MNAAIERRSIRRCHQPSAAIASTHFTMRGALCLQAGPDDRSGMMIRVA